MKSTTLSTVVQTLLLTTTSFLLCWLVVTHMGADLIAFFAALLVFQTYLLVRFINRTNRKLSFFFQALLNEDTGFKIPINGKSTTERELNRTLNSLRTKMESIMMAAKEQELQYRAVVEQATSGLMAFNEKGFILISNSAAHSLLQCPVLTHLSQIERQSHQLYAIISSMKHNERKTITLSDPPRQRVLSIKANMLRLQKTDLTLLSIADIKPELDARETDSWIKLTRVLSHEIMNGIAPIASTGKTLSGYFSKNDSVVTASDISQQIVNNTARGLEVIVRQSEGLSRFVEHYRKFSRIPQPKLQPTLIVDLFDKIKVLSTDLVTSAGIALVVEDAPAEASAMVDEQLIIQALINLISNAVDACKDKGGGAVVLRYVNDTSGQFAIEVEDSGVGISQEIAEEIFVPFFTTKSGGSGIGLSIVRQIMHLHGGEVSAKSVVGEGTTFSLVFGG